MVLQNNSQALEFSSDILLGEIEMPLQQALSELKEKNFPKNLLEEIESFATRNSWSESVNNGKLHLCCAQCVKLHAINIIQDLSLDEELITSLDEVFPINTKHEEYYLDEGKVIRVS
jgi:hypothetical protein